MLVRNNKKNDEFDGVTTISCGRILGRDVVGEGLRSNSSRVYCMVHSSGFHMSCFWLGYAGEW